MRYLTKDKNNKLKNNNGWGCPACRNHNGTLLDSHIPSSLTHLLTCSHFVILLTPQPSLMKHGYGTYRTQPYITH